ncbi:MAG: 50S ribosomal protein L11 methyltransferase [Clostridia bacterium]|nr:50S ribosomal protein L11 methyltransferase [Clostridia bacterium]
MAGSWTKITVTGKTKNLDDITAVMSMVDNGLMIEDYSDFSLNGMYGELVDDSILNADKETVKVSLFVPEERSYRECMEFIALRLSSLSVPHSIEVDGICEDDWAESWKQYYKPVSVGKITIVPAWEKYEAADGEITVRMDPGMAFGTGTHETTRLVMRLMQELSLTDKRVLDVGTGSGILSICASKLGAKKCNAYDIDPVAVKVARENVREDGCSNVTVEVSDLLKNVDLSEGKYDFCVANIVSDIIIRMLKDIDKYLIKSSPLILSGIIGDRADEVRNAVLSHGFSVEKEINENDWVGMLVRI